MKAFERKKLFYSQNYFTKKFKAWFEKPPNECLKTVNSSHHHHINLPSIECTTTPKPEDNANKIYNIIKGFKGSKPDLYKKLEEQFINEFKNLKVLNFSEENWRKVVELTARKITKDDLITADEFRKFEYDLLQKWKIVNKFWVLNLIWIFYLKVFFCSVVYLSAFSSMKHQLTDYH